jgi:integrase
MSVSPRFYLFKRSNGVYFILIDQDGHRRWRSTGAKLKSEALQALTEFQEHRELQAESPKPFLLSEFTREYLEYLRSVHTAKGRDSAVTALREFLRIVGDLPLLTVGVREIESFVARKRATVSDHSVRTYFVTLASAFETARPWGYVAKNKFREVEKPKLREILPCFPSRQDFGKHLQMVNNNDHRHLYLSAVCSGMRLSELTSLEWNDIDFARKTIYVHNKGSFTTKSKRNRVIPMNEMLWNVLASRRERASFDLVFHDGQGRRLTKEVAPERSANSVPSIQHFLQ